MLRNALVRVFSACLIVTGVAGCGVPVVLQCPAETPYVAADGLCYVDALQASSYRICRDMGVSDAEWRSFAQVVIGGVEGGLTRLEFLQANSEFCEGDSDCEDCLNSILATMLQ